MTYEIVADMSLDIDRKFMEENDIRFLPMEYSLGDEVFHCEGPETDEMMRHYYDRLRGKVPTKTSQITPFLYEEYFTEFVEKEQPILYLCLSSGLSNTYDSARLAVENLKDSYEGKKKVEIEVVDTLGATGGMGLLAEMACRNRAEGMSLKENADWLREHASSVYYWFKVEDLMYLMRGGRVSATSAVLGTALNIKPVLTINGQGKLDTIAKKRGNKQAVKYMLQRFEEMFDDSVSDIVYICCADCISEAEKLRETILKNHPALKVRVTMLSPIIGAHTGPDMLALIHFGHGKR